MNLYLNLLSHLVSDEEGKSISKLTTVFTFPVYFVFDWWYFANV